MNHLTSNQRVLIDEIEAKLGNKSIMDLSEFFEMDFTGKSAVYNLLIKILFQENVLSFDDFRDEGLMIKTVPVNLNHQPFESMSFTCKSLKDLVYEEWGSESSSLCSELLRNLQNVIVIIPIIKKKVKGKYNDWCEWKTGNIAVYNPGKEELTKISIEWNEAKKIILEGVVVSEQPYGNGTRQTNNLLKASKTKFIHMRPHGANRYDIDLPYKEYTKGRIEISKQSFWLNKNYLSEILRDYRWRVN